MADIQQDKVISSITNLNDLQILICLITNSLLYS